MLTKTEGIVLHTLKYTDNSIIAKIFTREFGTTSFMVKGVHGKKSGFKPAYFLPLTLLEINMYRQEKKGLQSLKELRVIPLGAGAFDHIVQHSIALFMAEVLYKSLEDGYVNSPLFELLKQEIIQLGNEDKIDPVTPSLFLIRLSRELGIAPLNNRSEERPVFSISEGAFIPNSSRPDLAFHFSNECSEALNLLMQDKEVQLSQRLRNELLENLIRYFQYHIPSMSGIKSQAVLNEVFHGN